MSACQTWATSSQFRHPWYDTQTMKRKGRDNDTPTVSPPLTKRQRRYSDLEEGFAYMSLANQPPYRPFAPDTISVQEIPVSTIMDAEMSSASSSPSLRPQAYTVEEPTIPEVNMKKSSWYEPERDRIVITDLDSFTQSDDEDEQDISVNPALLEKIRANAIVDRSQLPSAPTSQALVLFKPLPWASAIDDEARRWEREVNEERAVKVKSYEPAILEDDAMDVEI